MKLPDENLKDFAVKLMDKISDRITWLADRDTSHKHALQTYIKEIEANETLSPQTKAVLIYNSKRDIKRWANTKEICTQAVGLINPDASPDQIDPDWANLFMEKAANVSTEEMQKLWAHVLAQECNEPNSMPKALLQAMEAMEKQEAEDFMSLSAFCVKINGEENPFIIRDLVNDYYSKHGLGLDNLHHLETLGLINLDLSVFGGIAQCVKDDDVIEYFGKKLKGAELSQNEDNHVSFGCVALSYVGKALIKIVSPNEAEGFFDNVFVPYVKDNNTKSDDNNSSRCQ